MNKNLDCPVVGIPTFNSHTVSNARGSFTKKNSSPRRFFYVDMTKVQSVPRENLKIFVQYQKSQCAVQSSGYKPKVIVHTHKPGKTRYWSPVQRTLKLFLTFFLKEKIQPQDTSVPISFFVFLGGRFCNFFWFNRTSKIRGCGGSENTQKKIPEWMVLSFFILNR